MVARELNNYALLGHPVSHSLSPRLHRAFAEQTGQQLSYLAIDVPLSQFDTFWHKGLGLHLAGANITLPLKQQAFELADVASGRASAAAAANTLTRQADGSLWADNTDGIGLVTDLEEKLASHGSGVLAGSRLLLLGAGGAARGVLGPLLAEKPASLLIANRTAEKAVQLAERFAGAGAISAIDLAALADRGPFDGIINASAAGHTGTATSLSAGLLGAHSWSYDLSYGAAARPFLDQAQAAGCRWGWDGLGMLVEQAAASFELWCGVRPDTRLLKRQLTDW